ncbi:hypothetical protein JHN52_37185, partial [Streptomyces sp. MBT97]|uniref:hypothetical protein n=1 Tax=Streptomyces sp. MBT97 TaxID=2800411 RepID=UPI00190AB2C5
MEDIELLAEFEVGGVLSDGGGVVSDCDAEGEGDDDELLLAEPDGDADGDPWCEGDDEGLGVPDGCPSPGPCELLGSEDGRACPVAVGSSEV